MKILSLHDLTLMAVCLVPAVLLAWGLINLAASSALEARRRGVPDERFGAVQLPAQVEAATISERSSPEDAELAAVIPM